MERLIRKIFFWDSPAQGAFFALTLAGIGTWLLLSLFHFLWTLGVFGWIWLPMWNGFTIFPVLLFGAAEVILLLYSLFLVNRFTKCWWSSSYAKIAGLLYLVPFVAVSWLAANISTVLLLVIVTSFWFFPLLLRPKIGWKLWLGHGLCWSIGLLICDIVWTNLTNFTMVLLDLLTIQVAGVTPHPVYSSIQKFLHIQGAGWICFLVAGILFLLLGYLLTARLYGRIAGLPFRQIFGRGVIVLWILFGINYAAQLFLAWQGVKEANQAIADLEQHFKRPVTAKALGELYYNGEQPDPDFWDREKALQENIEPCPDELKALLFPLPGEFPPEAMQQVRQYLQSIESDLSQWEQMFVGSIPPMKQNYQPGSLVVMLLPHFGSIRQLNRASLRRVRLALEDGDVAAALAACERQAYANNSLLRETSLIGGLVWITCTEIWMESLKMLLESRALSDEQLLDLESRLKTAEKHVTVMQDRALYSEAVMGLDCFEMLANPPKTGSQDADKGLISRDLRFFVPQLWWHAALDKANMARSFQVSGFSEMPPHPEVNGRPLILSNMLLPALTSAGKPFSAVTARLRAMQALIAAEQYRRQHGKWPEQLENLPEDPFTGEPLRYHYGECVYTHKVATWDEESRSWRVDSQLRTAPAVQVWSLGPDKIDDRGLQRAEQEDGRRSDDIRALLRLNPQQP